MRLKGMKLLWISFLLFFFVGTAIPVSASASEIDWNKTGSVSVTLADGDDAISGAEITLYKAAEAESRNGNLHFVYTDAFKALGDMPYNMTDEAAIRNFAEYAAENNISGKTLVTNENGSVCFENLSLGLYIVVQSGSVDGYSTCSPFLISLPVQGDNGWIYDIDATPKTDIVRLIDITVKKVWNDDGNDRPDSVTVQLQNGDSVADTVTLDEQNGWTYTWTNLPKSDSWSVKEVNVPKGYTATYQKEEFEYTVTNTPTLIQTGQLKWPIPLLAGAGTLLFAFGWIIYFKGKRKDNA